MKCKKKKCPYVGVIDDIRRASGAKKGEITVEVVMRLKAENDLLRSMQQQQVIYVPCPPAPEPSLPVVTWTAVETTADRREPVTNCHGLGEDKC